MIRERDGELGRKGITRLKGDRTQGMFGLNLSSSESTLHKRDLIINEI